MRFIRLFKSRCSKKNLTKRDLTKPQFMETRLLMTLVLSLTQNLTEKQPVQTKGTPLIAVYLLMYSILLTETWSEAESRPFKPRSLYPLSPAPAGGHLPPYIHEATIFKYSRPSIFPPIHLPTATPAAGASIAVALSAGGPGEVLETHDHLLLTFFLFKCRRTPLLHRELREPRYSQRDL